MEREEKTLRRIHYRSDFDFLLRLLDGTGEKEIGVPGFDWKAKFYTAPYSSFEASYIGGEFKNCFYGNDRIHIVCKNHKLQCGELKVVFESLLPDGIYPDGIRREVTPAPLDIELVKEAGDNYTITEAEALMPYIKGERGEKGEKGDPGEQGPQGEKGDRGVPGLSAYHLAVSGGYAGTSEEFEHELAQTVNRQEKLVSTADIVVDGGKLNLSEEAKRRAIIDLWRAACVITVGANRYQTVGGYDEDTGHFWLGSVNDLTYEDAVLGLARTHRRDCTLDGLGNVRAIPPIYQTTTATYLNFKYCWNARVMALSGYWGSFCCGPQQWFISCRALVEIVGILDFSLVTNGARVFEGCVSLANLNIKNLKHDLSLAYTAAISRESLVYMIAEAANTSDIAITVHKDVYAKLTDESNEEWHALIAVAADKNIRFATA